ncbi:hypothetical protein Efla_001617 [Eimeria flavescens]
MYLLLPTQARELLAQLQQKSRPSQRCLLTAAVPTRSCLYTPQTSKLHQRQQQQKKQQQEQQQRKQRRLQPQQAGEEWGAPPGLRRGGPPRGPRGKLQRKRFICLLGEADSHLSFGVTPAAARNARKAAAAGQRAPTTTQEQQQQRQQQRASCCCCFAVAAAAAFVQQLPLTPLIAAWQLATWSPSAGAAATHERKGGGFYFATSLPPTVVSCCCSVRLRSPVVPTLVLARPRSLVFLHPAASSSNSSSSSSALSEGYAAAAAAGGLAAAAAEEDEEGLGASSLFFSPPVVLPCRENVSALAAVPRRPPLSAEVETPGGEAGAASSPQEGLEDLLLLTASQSLLLFTYCSKQRTVVRIQVIDLRLPCFRRLKGRPLVAVCPLTGDIAIHQYEFRLQYLQRRRRSSSSSSSSSSSGAESSRAKRVKEHEEQQQQHQETRPESHDLSRLPPYSSQRVVFVNELGLLDVAFVSPDQTAKQHTSSSSRRRRSSSNSSSSSSSSSKDLLFGAPAAAAFDLSPCGGSSPQCQVLCCLFEATATSSSCAGAPLAAPERFVRLLHLSPSAAPFLNTDPTTCSCGSSLSPLQVAQGASRLLPLPPSVGGFLVCAADSISWFSLQPQQQHAKRPLPPLNTYSSSSSSSGSGLFRRGSSASAATAAGLTLVCAANTFPGCDDLVSVVLLEDTAAAAAAFEEQQQHEHTCMFVAADLKGRVLQGVLYNSPSKGSSSSSSTYSDPYGSLSVCYLGQACEAPQLSALGPRTFFVASTCSDSLVLEVLDPGTDDCSSSSSSSSSVKQSRRLEEGVSAAASAAEWLQQQQQPGAGQQGGRLRLLETLANLGPIVDCCIVDFEGRGQRQLALCCGSGRSGAIRFVRDGLFLHSAGKVALQQPVEGLWCLRLQQEGNQLLLAAVSTPRHTTLLQWRQQKAARGASLGGVAEARRWGEAEGELGEIVELEGGRGGFVCSQPSLLCCLFLAAADPEEEDSHMQADGDGAPDGLEGDISNLVVLQVLPAGVVALEAAEASLAFRAAVSLQGIVSSSSGGPCFRLQPCSSGEALWGPPPAAAGGGPPLLLSAASVAPVGGLRGLPPWGDVLLLTADSVAATVSLRGSSFQLLATRDLGSEASAAHAARLDVGEDVSSADAHKETLAAAAPAAGVSVALAAVALFAEGTVSLLSLPALEPVMSLDACRGEMGVWVVSTLVACIGPAPLCFCGLSNGRVVVFRLEVTVGGGDSRCVLRGVSRGSGAAVPLQVSLQSGRVVHMGGAGPVRLVSLPRLRPASSTRRKSSSSRRGSHKERGDSCLARPAAARGWREEIASRHLTACVVCCCSLTYNHVPCVSLQLAADFSCEATDPQLGLMWVEGQESAPRAPASPSRSPSSSSSNKEGWTREGGGEQRGAVLHVGVRERGQRLHSRVLPLGRTVDALCPLEAAGVVALACPAEVVDGREEPSCVLFVNPLTRAVEGRFTLPHASYVPAALCLAPPIRSAAAASSSYGLKQETANAAAAAAAAASASCSSSSFRGLADAAAAADGDTSAELLCVGTAEVVLSDCEPLHGCIHVLRVTREHGMLLISEAAAPLQLSAGVHELRAFDGMILAACNHQALGCDSGWLCLQLKLFALKHQAGDPAEDAPMIRRSKHQRRYQQQQQQRRGDGGMDATEEMERDSLSPMPTEPATADKGLGSLGRLTLQLVAAFSASTFIASLDILDNRMICVGDMIASACFVEWRPAEKTLREVARDMRCAWPLGVSLLSADDCLMSDGEQNLWVLRRAYPDSAFKAFPSTQDGQGQQRPAAAAAAARLLQQQREEETAEEAGGGSSSREQRRQQQQGGSSDWAARGPFAGSGGPLSDAQQFRLSPCAALHTPVSLNKLIHGGISFRLEEGCLLDSQARQQLLASAADGAAAAADTAAAATAGGESLGLLLQSALEGPSVFGAAQRGDSSSSSSSSSRGMQQQPRSVSLCVPSHTRTWVSAEGSIGVVLRLNEEETFSRLSLVEEAVGDIMDCISTGTGPSSHGARGDSSLSPYKGFIDGDSLERLLLLRPKEQREVYKLARAWAAAGAPAVAAIAAAAAAALNRGRQNHWGGKTPLWGPHLCAMGGPLLCIEVDYISSCCCCCCGGRPQCTAAGGMEAPVRGVNLLS